MPATLIIRVLKEQPSHVRRGQARCDNCIGKVPNLPVSATPMDSTVRECVIAFVEGSFELCESCRVELSN